MWDGSTFTPVLRVALNPASALVTAKLSSGAELRATGSHIILRADGSDVHLDRIAVGDVLLTSDKSEVSVVDVSADIGRSVELNTTSIRICVGRVVISDSTRSVRRKTNGDV